MARKKDLSKEARISAEDRRLRRNYKEVQKDKLAIIDGLIRRASYMRITLEDMENDLNKHGFVELFSQSDKLEPYERERPVARLYNTMNKNYQAITKQLTDLLPKEAAKVEDDGFDAFILSRDN